MSKSAWCSWAVAAMGVAAPVSAQQTAAERLNVIVTATRIPTPIEEVLPSVVLIDRDEIDRSLAGDAADLLRFHSGLDIARNGGPGQTTSLFIRGAESNHTLVMVDGVRINPGTVGLPALQNLSPELIERIEVVKGPRSSLWGSDAIGGVVNVITRRGSQDGWVAEIGYGEYDTREASLTGGLGGSAGSVDLGVSWIDSDGFPTFEADDLDRGYDNLSTTLAGRTSVGAVDLSARYWRAEGNTQYSDFFLAPVDQDFVNSTAALSAALPTGPDGRLTATASYFEDETEQRQSPDRLQTQRVALDLQQDWRANRHHTLTAGAMYSDEDAESVSFGEEFDESTSVWNFFLQDQVHDDRQRATFAVGLTDHETFGSEYTWNVDYAFDLTDNTELVLSAGTGFRAPDATDRFGFGGNPDLDHAVRHRWPRGRQVVLFVRAER